MFDYSIYQNRVLPFLWLKGEDHDTIREYLEVMAASDIHEVCLESRPHPDFCGDGWWEDLGFIIDECKRLGMKIWILDDAHFPTGFANGALQHAGRALRKKVLVQRTVDIVGPIPSVSIKLGAMLGDTEEFYDIAFTCDGEAIDPEWRLTAGAAGAPERIVFDAPAGIVRAHVLSVSYETSYNDDYINMVDADSCRQLIDAVYEPHWEHFSHEFGKTIRGFFSDEPGFANEKGTTLEEGTSDSLIGKAKMPLPWSDELERRLRARWGSAFVGNLACLWDREPVGADARAGYMEEATRLYEGCFCGQVGAWCRAHGVEYIGHVIEDKDGHARLGTGVGHYFRAVGGQDMAGVDIVINQLIPGIEAGTHSYGRGVWDMEFYAYALAKLGASAAHLDPKKQGRCMAEVFGAFGWHEGLRLMKWICDHFLVRGVNWFVPHAFSMASFPDRDCPPHFYAHGKDPQFRHFHLLMTYLNRMGTLLSGGYMQTPVAVLYHADAEWAGDAMPIQRVAAQLARVQVDYDFVPAEAFASDGDQGRYQVAVEAGAFAINGQRFRCLVVPRRAFLTADTARFIERAQEADVSVIFVDELPGALYGEGRAGASMPTGEVVALEDLGRAVSDLGMRTVVCSEPQPWLRACRYHKGGAAYLFIVNEHPKQGVATAVTFANGTPISGDAFDVINETAARSFSGYLELAPYESVLIELDAENVGTGTESAAAAYAENACDADVAFGVGTVVGAASATGVGAASVVAIGGPWDVTAPSGKTARLSVLCDLTDELFAGEAGEFTYCTGFALARDVKDATIDLGDVYETAEVILDGKSLGVRVCPPYRFAAGSLMAGEHELAIAVINTLDHAKVPDIFATLEPVEPTGLMGPVEMRA